jgi:hypothetical protein
MLTFKLSRGMGKRFYSDMLMGNPLENISEAIGKPLENFFGGIMEYWPFSKSCRVAERNSSASVGRKFSEAFSIPSDHEPNGIEALCSYERLLENL